MVDTACLTSSTFFLLSNILSAILFANLHHQFRFSLTPWQNLDPSYLQDEWTIRLKYAPMANVMSFFKTLAWFSFCIPILQISWILSKGGRQRIGLHGVMISLALGGSVMELVSRLMTIGLNGTTDWIAKDFQLDRWVFVEEGDEDYVGWRVLEIVLLMGNGLMSWIDAFEYLAISIILTSLFISLRSDQRCSSSSQKKSTFGTKLSNFGLLIGILSFFGFLGNILRFISGSGVIFMGIAALIGLINSVIFLPIWLLILGVQIEPVREYFENGDCGNNEKREEEEEEEMTEGQFLSDAEIS